MFTVIIFIITIIFTPLYIATYNKELTPGVVIIYGLLILLHCIYLENRPSALDVYQGKTTLEYNSIIVDNKVVNLDSTVVFKPSAEK